MAGGGEVKESYRKADGDLLEERFDCGTGAGGFKEGNTCAGGGGGVEEISRNSPANKKVAQEIESLKKFVRNSNNEKRIAINAKTGEKIAEKIGNKDRVDWGDEENKKIIEADSIIDVHNHPDNSSFSPDDWGAFGFSNVEEMHIVTKNGDQYSIKKTADFRALPLSQRTPKALKEKWEKLSDRDLTKKTIEESIFDINKDMANELKVKITKHN
jgi:hypothetical protein